MHSQLHSYLQVYKSNNLTNRPQRFILRLLHAGSFKSKVLPWSTGNITFKFALCLHQHNRQWRPPGLCGSPYPHLIDIITDHLTSWVCKRFARVLHVFREKHTFFKMCQSKACIVLLWYIRTIQILQQEEQEKDNLQHFCRLHNELVPVSERFSSSACSITAATKMWQIIMQSINVSTTKCSW